MLQLVFGKAASGKTTYIHSLIEKEKSDNTILLVPEQFTFETEKQMLHLFGSSYMSKINVLSFSRMCEAVGQLYGGLSGIRIDDCQRIILVSRAVKNTVGSLKLFKRYVKNPEFIKQITDIITEFKQAGISPEKIFSVLENIKSTALELKLREIAEIYAAYNQLLEKVYIDPLDDIGLLLNKTTKYDYFKGKTVYIDAFKGFTGAQIKLLKLMLLRCEKVVISFCADSPDDKFNGASVFSNIQKTANYLINYANSNHIQILPHIILENSYFKNNDLKHLENILSEKENSAYCGSESVVIGSLRSPLEEVSYIFKKIHFLVRTKGYKFGDFVVIARNIEKYERLILSASKKYNVPCYLDKRRALSASPVARLVLAALKAAKSLNTESILVLLKTGFLGFDDLEISLLEEYTFTWDINHDTWCNDWNMDPDGMIVGEYKSTPEEIKERLDEINALRRRIIAPLLVLKKNFGGDAKGIATAVYNFMVNFKVTDNLKNYCDNLLQIGQTEDAEFAESSWDALMDTLDNIVRCYSDEEITIEEFIDTLELSFSGVTIGSIPKTLDEVTCGNADRIRTSRPKIAFVMGLNQGEFPQSVSDNGLLLKADRIRLEDAGLEISDRFNSFAVDENFLVYSSICSASEGVYVLCHRQNLSGAETEESSVFTKLKKTFNNYKNLDKEIPLPETDEEGFSTLSNGLCSENLKEELSKYFSEKIDYKARLDNILKMEKEGRHRLSKELCDKLFGDDLYLSASKIETYNGCSFSYFCKYVLNISTLKKADLDNLQRGTIVHFIMENVLRQLGKSISSADEDELEILVNKYLEIYLSEIDGFEYLNKPRFNFLCERIAKMSTSVLLHIAEEFKVCSFEPVSFELDISSKGDLPLYKIKFKNDKTVNLNGKIDRVDSLKGTNGQTFIRVVDYKTGSKEFHLPDILFGLNMQMLVYLCAIKNLGKEKFGNVSPAGVLYKPSKRSVSKDGEAQSSGFAMNGMVVDDEEVSIGMDSTNSGKFAPKNTGKARKGNPVISKEAFNTVLNFVDSKIATTANKITDGIFDVNPVQGDNYSACKYCEFSSVCGIENKNDIPSIDSLSNDEVIEKMKEELGNV